MKPNMLKLPLVDMTRAQFRDWLRQITNESLFTDRDKLAGLLAQNANREKLEESFREFFEAYSYDLAFELDVHEACVLKVLEMSEEFAYLKQRVTAVETQRKTSSIGRMARRLGGIPNDPALTTIKVNGLSDDEFRKFTDKLTNSELFAAREKIVKLMKEPASLVNPARLQAAFYEFFVCHLELEQFLEGYEYDPDEEFEIRPMVAEELDDSIANIADLKLSNTNF